MRDGCEKNEKNLDNLLFSDTDEIEISANEFPDINIF